MQKKNLGILVISISYSPNIGGVETHLDDLTKYLTKRNYRVYVVTYQPITTKVKGLAKEKKDNLEVYRINWFGHNWFHKLEPYFMLEFIYLFPGLFVGTLIFMIKNHRKIDAIHAHGFIASSVTRLINLIYHKKATMSIHAIYNFQNRGIIARFARWILAGFDSVMPLAAASREDLIKAGIPNDKIIMYRQWVDQNIFKPRDKNKAKKDLGLDDRFTVLFVGRFIEKKGVVVLLEVAKQLPKVNFIFVGDGPEVGRVTEEGKKYKNIIFVGSKNQNETAMYYSASDVVIVPSLYEEGFARVVLETLSSGRPIIASNKGCLPEMISSEVGFLVDPQIDIIKDKILKLHNNTKLLNKMTKSARPFAELRYSDKNGDVIASTYI